MNGMTVNIRRIIILFLGALLISLAACTSVPAKSPTTTMPASPTSHTTETIQTSASPGEIYNEVKSFLDSAKEAYRSSQSSNLTPNIKNFSDSDFLSLNVMSDSVIIIGGKQYEYQIISDQSSANFKNYIITSTLEVVIPGMGGTQYIVQFRKDNALSKELHVPKYQRPWMTNSVIIFTYQVEKLLFLSLNYNTGRINDSGAGIPEIASLWLILYPV